jgi:hypothetical protein
MIKNKANPASLLATPGRVYPQGNLSHREPSPKVAKSKHQGSIWIIMEIFSYIKDLTNHVIRSKR